MSQFFDEVEKDASKPNPTKPIWAMDLDDPDNEKNILDWLTGELEYLRSLNETRHRHVQRNLALYKGIQYLDQDRADIRERGQDRNQPVRKIVANHLHDLVQNRVSRLIKFKPAVAILPTNDEFGDKISAQVCDALLSHIWYSNNFEGKLSVEFVKACYSMGESYLFITWNPDKGDLHPDYVKLKEKADKEGGKVPLLDESGNQAKDSVGNPIWIERPVRVGDVDLEVVLCPEVFLQKKNKWDDVDYLFRIKVMPVERARLLYPDKADKIQVHESVNIYDYEQMKMRQTKNEVVIYEFYHKKTLGMDKGRWIVFTSDTILANKDYPYDHGELPCIRMTDIDVPGELYGRCGIDNIKPLTNSYNNLLNLVLRNQILVSHPKWMMPAGAAKKESLGNDITIVEYKGPVAPVLVQANPTGAETFNFMESLKEQFQQIYGSFGVSRGEPPPGIESGIALQWLSEQEEERFNEPTLKWEEAIRRIATMTLSVAGTYYDASDQRFIRVLGKGDSWMSVFFDVAHLSKDYDVRLQNSSALPRTKAARLNYIEVLSNKYPTLFSPEQVVDMMDLAQDQKFVSAATVSVKSADAENEMMLSGDAFGIDTPAEPSKWDDHILHWKTHLRAMQQWAFKYQTPPEVQAKLIDHLRAHEMFMVDYAQVNPAYGQQLVALAGFPIVYEVPKPQPQMAPAPQEPMQGEPMPPEVPQEEGLDVNTPPPPVSEQTAGTAEPIAPEVPPAE